MEKKCIGIDVVVKLSDGAHCAFASSRADNAFSRFSDDCLSSMLCSRAWATQSAYVHRNVSAGSCAAAQAAAAHSSNDATISFGCLAVIISIKVGFSTAKLLSGDLLS